MPFPLIIKLFAFNPWSGEVLNDSERQSHDDLYNTDSLSLLNPFNNIDIRNFEFERIEEMTPTINKEGQIRYLYHGSFRPFQEDTLMVILLIMNQFQKVYLKLNSS